VEFELKEASVFGWNVQQAGTALAVEESTSTSTAAQFCPTTIISCNQV